MSDEETGTNNNSSAGGKGVGAAYLPFVQSGFNPSAAYKPVDIAGNVPNDELQKLGMTYAKNNLTGDIVWAGPLAMKETYIDANGQGGPLFTPVNGPNPQAAAAQAALSAPDATDASWFTNAGGVLSDSSKPQVGANDPSSPSFGGGTVGGLSSTNTAGAAYAPYVQAGVNPSAAYSPDQLSSNLTAQQLEQLGFTYAHNNLTGQDEYVGPIAIKETGTTGDGQTGPIWTPVNGPNPQAAAAQAALSAPDATDASWFTNAGGVLSDPSKPQVGANDPSSPSFGGGTSSTSSTHNSADTSTVTNVSPAAAQQAIISGGVEGYNQYAALGISPSYAYPTSSLTPEMKQQMGALGYQNLTGPDGQQYMVGPLAVNEGGWHSGGQSTPASTSLPGNSTFSVSAGNPAPVGPQTSTYTGTASHESANVSFAGSPESQEKSGSASAGGGGVVPSSTEAMLLENHEKRVDTDPTKIKKN